MGNEEKCTRRGRGETTRNVGGEKGKDRWRGADKSEGRANKRKRERGRRGFFSTSFVIPNGLMMGLVVTGRGV